MEILVIKNKKALQKTSSEDAKLKSCIYKFNDMFFYFSLSSDVQKTILNEENKFF